MLERSDGREADGYATSDREEDPNLGGICDRVGVSDRVLLGPSDDAERDETCVAESAKAGKAESHETRDPAGRLLHCAEQCDRKRDHEQAE